MSVNGKDARVSQPSRAVVSLAIVVAGAVGPGAPRAHAAPAQPPAVGSKTSMLSPVVLEAHVGQRSPEAAKALAVVLDDLERHGYAALPATIDRTLGRQVPRPGVLDGGKTAKDIAQEIETGLEFYDRGKFRDAEVALTLARQDIKRNPSLIVLDTTNEKSIFNAFVALALSQVKLNKTAEAVHTMTGLQRISGTPVDRAEYGPQAEQLWRSTQQRTRAMGLGALTITVNEATAMILVLRRQGISATQPRRAWSSGCQAWRWLARGYGSGIVKQAAPDPIVQRIGALQPSDPCGCRQSLSGGRMRWRSALAAFECDMWQHANVARTACIRMSGARTSGAQNPGVSIGPVD